MFIDALILEKSYFDIGQFMESGYIGGLRANYMVADDSSTVAAGASSLISTCPHRLASVWFPSGSAIQNPQTQQGASGVHGPLFGRTGSAT